MGIEQEQYQNLEGGPIASFPTEQLWAELRRRLGLKVELTPSVMSLFLGLLTIVLISRIPVRIFRFVRAYSAFGVRPKLTTRPKDLKQLNGSVWEFHTPLDGVPKMEIIFFHGAQLSNDDQAFWKTWLSRDETILWPKAWLAENFPDARILSISIDSAIRQFPGQKDTYLTIENLMNDIIWNSTCGAGQNCPVILAGHCFGGIIIKEFLLKCLEFTNLGTPGTSHVKKAKTFLDNCKAVFYYSTPNGGARLMDGLAYRDYILGRINEPLVKFLEILSPETSRINSHFRRLRNRFNPRLTTRAIGETLGTKLKDSMKAVMVVPEASARQDVDQIYWADADHFDVSRAKNNLTCSIFNGLKDLVYDYYHRADLEFLEGQADELIEKVGFDPSALATLGTVQATTLFEAVLRRYFLDEIGENGDDEDKEDEAYRPWESIDSEVRNFIEFAATQRPTLLGTAVKQLWQEMRDRVKIGLFIAQLAQLPRVASKIANDELQVGCVDKLVVLLDTTVNKKFQLQALRALYKLAGHNPYACDPDKDVKVKMLQAEHLLERVIMFLSERPDMERRCRWAASLFLRLIPIEYPRVKPIPQGPVSLSLSGKARHFRTCLMRVAMLLREDVKWDVQNIGLKVLLSIALLAFNFARSGNSNFIDASAISGLLGRAVTFLVPRVEGIQGEAVVALYILAQFRLDERLGLEVHMRRLATPNLLEKLDMMLSKENVSTMPDKTTCAARIIAALGIVPAIGELIVGFRNDDGCIVGKLLELLTLEDDVTEKSVQGEIGREATTTLAFLPVPDQTVATILSQNPVLLAYLYFLRGIQSFIRRDYKAALEDFNQALGLEYDGKNFLQTELGFRAVCALLLSLRGLVRGYLNDLNGALKDLDRGLEIANNQRVKYGCLKYRGLIKYKLGDEEGARRDANEAIALWPSLADEYSGAERSRYDSCLEFKDDDDIFKYMIEPLGIRSVEFLEYRLK